MKLSICAVVFLLCAHVHAASPTNAVVAQKGTPPVPAKQAGAAVLTADEAKRETGKIIDEWLKFFGVDFRAEIVCPELMATMRNELAKKSPVPLTVSHVYQVHTNGKSHIDFDLADLPAGFPPEMLAMTAQAMKLSEAGRAVERLSPSLFKSATQMLMSKEDFALIDVNENLIHVEVNQVNEPFFRNRMIRTLRCQVGRTTRTLDGLEFVFTDNKRVRVDVKNAATKVPGSDKPVNMPSEATFTQDIGFAGLPPRFTVFYKEYTFTKF